MASLPLGVAAVTATEVARVAETVTKAVVRARVTPAVVPAETEARARRLKLTVVTSTRAQVRGTETASVDAREVLVKLEPKTVMSR